MGKSKMIKRIAYLSTAALLIGMLIFVSRGPHISNALKKIILPELENMTGRKVIAQSIYLNLFPLFIEAKGVKLFDDAGNRVLTVDRIKGYPKLSAMRRRKIALKRIVIKESELWTDREQADDIIKRVKEYLLKEDPKKMKVIVDVIEVRDGGFGLYDPAHGAVLRGKGLSAEVLLGGTARLKAQIKEFIFNIRDFPELKGGADAVLFFRKDGIDIKNVTLRAYDSELKAGGFYSAEGKGDIKTSVEFSADSIKKVFGLKRSGEGKIFAKGDIKFGEGSPFVDIRVRGNFYLQSLMELLKVKERVEGWLDFDGKISGAVSKLTGSADATLKKGNLFDVAVDSLKCNIAYNNGVMSFENGKAALYNGRADAEVMLKMPDIDRYSVKVNFTDVDSQPAFKLIGLDIEVPKGKVKGELFSSDSEFNPSGWFGYEANPTFSKGGMGGVSSDLIARVKIMKGEFKVQGDILSLSNTEIRTDKSALDINGTVAMSASALNLKGKLITHDIADLTFPHFDLLKGTGEFEGTITGKFDDPLIDGAVRMTAASLKGYGLDNVSGELLYRKNLLEIKQLSVKSKNEEHTAKGHIKFDSAKEIFDLKQRDYRLSVSLRGADIERLAAAFYKKLPFKGKLNTDFKIAGNGSNPEYSGSAAVVNAEAYKFSADSLTSDFYYKGKDIAVRKAVLKKGGSTMIVEGRISGMEKFSFNASGSKLFLNDMGLKGMPDDAVLNVNATGSGTFDNPSIKIDGKLSGGTFKGKPLGAGDINASIESKDILFSAMFFNEKVIMKGRGYLSDLLPWNAEITILSGRYDFLLSPLLKDVPDDLVVNMKGNAVMSGTRKTFSSAAVLSQVNAALYGHSFSNDSDIKFKFDNRKMSFSVFSMRSGNASFNMRGGMEIGREYNISLEGSSALSPLKGFSKKIGVLRGDANFALTVGGKWDNPHINGNLNVTNGLFGLKDMHQRVSSINGLFYFEGNKIAVRKLSGKLGGGDIDASGVVYLSGFNLKRFYLDAKLNNITSSVSKDFSINFNGNVLYKGTLDVQNITGDVRVNRARYRERVEWKSWLLKAKTAERPRGELTGIEKAVLNVKIYGAENIIVDNNIAHAPLKVDMVLKGTIGHPLLFGRIESKEGKVYFRNSEFRILNASADFTDPNRINPVMEIVAQTIVKGYNIRLNLEGQMERFNLSLVSDPPLEETDILSLLTVGQIGKQLKGLEGGIGAGEAASFLTGKVQDVFEERIKSITGIDRVQVDPYVSKSTGTVGPRLTASKRLLGDKLFVTYTSAVGSTEEQVLKLEYILDKNVSLVGVRDEKGSVGGDIKFRFEFK
ncbi:MAG: translocation/assembly module TamB domain-containing protein [Thermodesulfovibrionales bacterium]|nr:translocation/assembly module TamB domain-containing protein [Thermodesulfovibrionales bacterium]